MHEFPPNPVLGSSEGIRRAGVVRYPGLRIQRKVSRSPALGGPPFEHFPSLLYRSYGLGVHPASVVKLRAEQLVEFLGCVDVHQEEPPALAAKEAALADLARLHDLLYLRPEPLIAHGSSFRQNDVFVNLESDVEQHFWLLLSPALLSG